MARFCPLFSGSSGNSIYIGNNDGGILVDTGMSAKKIGEALFNIGVAPESLNAVFVTHEHSDHIKGLRVFASKYHIKVYGTKGTLSALDDMGILNGKFETEEVSFSGNEAGPLFVTPFHTSHDARESCGYKIDCSDGRKISIATDLGLLTAIPLFDSSKGIKFLTYAAPFIRNAMTDLIRDVFSQYEQRMTSTIDGLALQKIRLDEILPGEERLLRIEAIADPTVKSPEQIYVDKETMRELYEGLGRLSEREQAYLLYRYGFTDDVEHTMIGSAIHFNLRKSRAKTLEDTAMDNLWLELPWWF